MAVGSLAGLSYGLKKGRDTQRIQSMQAAQTAAFSYYADHQSYPPLGVTVTVSALPSSYSTNVDGAAVNGYNIVTLAESTNFLKDYFEGEWKNPPTKDPIKSFAYYGSANGLGFAVCSLMEIKNGGNVTNKCGDGDVPCKKWGCFCLGPLAKEVGCKGLTDPRGE